MTGWDNQKYGDQAENLFEQLALPCFFVLKPRPDSDGWDFLLRHRSHLTLPSFQTILKQSPPFRYWVQVKSVLAKTGTQRKAKRVSVPLARLLRAAKDSNPWFYFIVRHSERWEPLDLFLIHIDDSWVNRIAKRWCEKTTKDPEKMMIDLPLTARDALAGSFEALERTIVSTCGDDSVTYSAQKRQWWEKAGLEGTEGLVRFFTPPGTAGIKAVSDMLLGLNHMEGATLINVEKRFGTNFEELLTANGRMTAQPATRTSVSLFARGSEIVTLSDAALYTNFPILSTIPDAPALLRVSTSIVDMLINLTDNTASWTFHPLAANGRIRPHLVGQLHKLLNLFGHTSENNEPLTLRLGPTPPHLPKLPDLNFSPTKPPKFNTPQALLYEYSHALSAFSRLYESYGDLECTEASIFGNGPKIITAALLSGLRNDDFSIKIEGHKAIPTQTYLIPIAAVFSVDAYRGYALGYAVGKGTANDDKTDCFKLSAPDLVVVQRDFGSSDLVTQDRLENALELLESEIAKLQDIERINVPSLVGISFD